jgi:hypothetical protein
MQFTLDSYLWHKFERSESKMVAFGGCEWEGSQGQTLIVTLLGGKMTLTFKFYNCAPRPRCAGCYELRVWKLLPILFMQINDQILPVPKVRFFF